MTGSLYEDGGDDPPPPHVLLALGLIGVAVGSVAAGAAAGIALGRGVATLIRLLRRPE